MVKMDNSNKYFAAKDAKAAANILMGKAKSWNNNIESNGYLDKLRSMWAAYHGAYYSDATSGHKISFGGEQGELVQLPVNHIRSLASNMIIMTTSNRPTMEARAVNTDYKSISQTKLANGILEYYMREKRLEKYLKNAVESAVVLAGGYIKLEWNATAGEVYDYLEDDAGNPDPNRPVYEGDIEFSNLSPFDVVVDGTKEHQNHDWMMCRTYKNKYDLAAKYPEYAEKIAGLETKNEIDRFRLGMRFDAFEETDDVPVFEFYHKKTDSLPNGRYMLFLTEEIVLQDIGLPYRVIPIFRISAGDIMGTPHGYTPLFDVLPIQEAINSLYSTILTNQNATGVQNFWSKPGSNFNITELSGGLNHIESMEKPEVLQLCSTPKEVFEFLGMLEKVSETITGINSVARGNPEASLHSGAALALIQSMALQFMSGLQQSYVALIEDVGGAIIKILQDYATAPRMIAIVGKANRTELKEFSGDDVSRITRVYVDVGNPLGKTISGRMEIASQLMQYQGDKVNPAQIIEVLNTGKLEALTSGPQDELDLITRENEALMDGENPAVIATDDHKEHIDGHKSVLQDPELRKDPGLVQRTLAHIQSHIQQLQQVDPNLLGLLGQQPLPPPAPPMPPQGGPAGPQAPSPHGDAPIPAPPIPEGVVGMTNTTAPGGQNQIQGPGIQGGVNLPHLPKVKGDLLANPAMQQQAMGNVK